MFRLNYRAAQGQQFAGTPGGGFLLDQWEARAAPQASTFYPTTIPIKMFPVVDVVDYGVSVLLDTEPSSVAVQGKIGRLSLAFAVSQVSTTACNPSFTVKRFRAGASAAVGTFNLTATPFPTVWGAVHLTGTQISNGTLQAEDVLVLSIVSNGAGQVSLPAFALTVDIEA